MDSLISENQSAFVPGRLLTDNALIAVKTYHHINGLYDNQWGAMVVKLDLAKVYDRVKLDFLRNILIRLGFSQSWVDLVMSCIGSPSFSIW